MAAPKFSDERAAMPMGWKRSTLVSVPRRRPMPGMLLSSPMACQRAWSSSVESRTRGWLSRFWLRPARRRIWEAETPSLSSLPKVLPEKRKCLFMVDACGDQCKGYAGDGAMQDAPLCMQKAPRARFGLEMGYRGGPEGSGARAAGS